MDDCHLSNIKKLKREDKKRKEKKEKRKKIQWKNSPYISFYLF